jgi:hypothetical protein
MARRRLSDTMAVNPRPAGSSEYHSRSVRKIENGHIVSESHEKDGEYSSREYFTRNPDRQVFGPDKGTGSVGNEGLSGAMKEICK